MLGAQLQLLVPTTIKADGVEVGVLKTQKEPRWHSTRFRKRQRCRGLGLEFGVQVSAGALLVKSQSCTKHVQLLRSERGLCTGGVYAGRTKKSVNRKAAVAR